MILIDQHGKVITAAERAYTWLQPVRRVFVERGPVLSSEGHRPPRPERDKS